MVQTYDPNQEVVVGLSFFMGCVSDDKYRKSHLGADKAIRSAHHCHLDQPQPAPIDSDFYPFPATFHRSSAQPPASVCPVSYP